MNNWQKFVEAKNSEKDEEKTGLDLDHDGEKGESKIHKDKIKKAKKELLEFFHSRKSSAQKILNESRGKSGSAQLSAWHFAAKVKIYTEVISAVNSNQGESFYLNKCRQLSTKLKFDKIKQEEFQKILGELEVWGESLIHIFN